MSNVGTNGRLSGKVGTVHDRTEHSFLCKVDGMYYGSAMYGTPRNGSASNLYVRVRGVTCDAVTQTKVAYAVRKEFGLNASCYIQFNRKYIPSNRSAFTQSPH